MRPAGKGLGGEGSFETETLVGVCRGVGMAMHRVIRTAAMGESVESFIVMLGGVKGSET